MFQIDNFVFPSGFKFATCQGVELAIVLTEFNLLGSQLFFIETAKVCGVWVAGTNTNDLVIVLDEWPHMGI